MRLDKAASLIPLPNPFGSPIYHFTEIDSTMAEARHLALYGASHGTVVIADSQRRGRGRTEGRRWLDERGSSLLFTLIFRYGGPPRLPVGFTLRAGLAVAEALEELEPELAGRVFLKWPNDVLIACPERDKPENEPLSSARKVCGILSESDGTAEYLGIGVNVGQTTFPAGIADKAVSLAQAFGGRVPDKFALLGALLVWFKRIFSDEIDSAWRDAVESRLYRRGKNISFIEGAADSGLTCHGRLEGLGPSGELLILRDGETQPRPFVTGELMF